MLTDADGRSTETGQRWSGRLLVGPATGKARPPTVDSLTDGVTDGPSRAEGTPTGQIVDTNQLTQ